MGLFLKFNHNEARAPLRNVSKLYNQLQALELISAVYQGETYIPRIVAPLGIIHTVAKQSAEVNEDGARDVRRKQVCMHPLGRGVWRNNN